MLRGVSAFRADRLPGFRRRGARRSHCELLERGWVGFTEASCAAASRIRSSTIGSRALRQLGKRDLIVLIRLRPSCDDGADRENGLMQLANVDAWVECCGNREQRFANGSTSDRRCPCANEVQNYNGLRLQNESGLARILHAFPRFLGFLTLECRTCQVRDRRSPVPSSYPHYTPRPTNDHRKQYSSFQPPVAGWSVINVGFASSGIWSRRSEPRRLESLGSMNAPRSFHNQPLVEFRPHRRSSFAPRSLPPDHSRTRSVDALHIRAPTANQPDDRPRHDLDRLP
jgi:hypothetical protein